MDTPKSELAAGVLARLSILGSELPIADVRPVARGEQNFVFTCSLRGERSILKATDSRHRSRAALETQLTMLGALRRYAANVCAPLPLGDDAIFETDVAGTPFYLVAYPCAVGRDSEIVEDGLPMGRALADLHAAMRRLPEYAFAQIAGGDNRAKVERAARALGVPERVYAAALAGTAAGERQLLHGDFNAANLKIDGPTVNVFDFDNCAYGSPAFDLANALYMVLFDGVTRGGGTTPYRAFRQAFLGGYRAAGPLDERAIDAFMGYRVLLLASWLQRPDDAPLFIRQSSPAWLGALRTFVRTYFGTYAGQAVARRGPRRNLP